MTDLLSVKGSLLKELENHTQRTRSISYLLIKILRTVDSDYGPDELKEILCLILDMTENIHDMKQVVKSLLEVKR